MTTNYATQRMTTYKLLNLRLHMKKMHNPRVIDILAQKDTPMKMNSLRVCDKQQTH